MQNYQLSTQNYQLSTQNYQLSKYIIVFVKSKEKSAFNILHNRSVQMGYINSLWLRKKPLIVTRAKGLISDKQFTCISFVSRVKGQIVNSHRM
jgi:hypothetical protein